MGELRKDYILDRYVIIASERNKRPHQFRQEKVSKHVDKCFFCPGNEHLTPEELGRIKKGDSWLIRYFPNKFPAVKKKGEMIVSTDNNFFTYSDSFGMHEVIVETPEHEKELADLSVSHIKKILNVYSSRIKCLADKPGIKYVSVFKNHGKDAGTSIIHTHSQVIAYNIVPGIIRKKEDACKDSCAYCRIIQIEKDSHRKCFENEDAVAFTPYASRFPFEIWILPKRHRINITEFNDREIESAAKILKKILVMLQELNSPYNMYLHYGTRNLHFQIIIAPRLAKWAGFELSTGTIINPISPEKAAKFYREG
ncbi:galactose-1-phosphate uridylyltransferase [Candidatus Woesearchaeota archaeon]|nr:galactose-1-phosphate uridylyltransferase [Candidatus Woesearchaeota archaeon]